MTSPALRHLMGAYFHQEWDIYGDEWDVIDVYVRKEAPMAAALVADIETTLSSVSDQAELRSFLHHDLGACYVAGLDGGTYATGLPRSPTASAPRPAAPWTSKADQLRPHDAWTSDVIQTVDPFPPSV